MKNLIEFKLENGESAFMQFEETESEKQTRQRVSRNRGSDDEEVTQAPRRFDKAIRWWSAGSEYWGCRIFVAGCTYLSLFIIQYFQVVY